MALSAQDRADVSNAYANLEAAAEKARAATTGVVWGVKSAWARVINAGSSSSGAVESARHTIDAVPRLEAKLEQLLASDTATHADAVAYVDECNSAAGISDVLEASAQLGAGAVVDQVVKPSVADLGGALQASGSGWLVVLRYLPWIALGLAALFVLGFGRSLAAQLRALLAPLLERRRGSHGS